MNDTYRRDSIYRAPCAAWAEQLAASQKDLTEAERDKLNEHVASCPACTAARTAYQQMDRDVVTMPHIKPRMLHAEQLPERGAMPSSGGLMESEEPSLAQLVEWNGTTSAFKAKQTRLTGNVQKKTATSRRIRLQRTLSMVAAVLIACGLIGSALLLFSRHTTNPAAPAHHVGHVPLYAALSDGTVYAFQPDTGAILWRHQLNLGGQSVLGGPGVAHGVVYIGAFNGTLYALRASNGSLLWQQNLGATPNRPIGGDDPQVIYVGAGPTLYALYTSDGSELWQRTGDSGISNPLYNYATPLTVEGGRVYGYDNSGLFALAASNGHTLWKGGSFNGVALVLAGDKVFATVGTGNQIQVSRISDGQVLHLLSVQGNLGYDQGRLYVANPSDQQLYILHPEDERIIRHVSMACSISDSPEPLVVQNGLVYTYSVGQSLKAAWICAMNVENGKKVWRWTATRTIADIRDLTAANDHLYFLYADSDFAHVELYALNTRNGAKLWRYAFPSNFPYNGYFAVGGGM